jgi:hypothetical protein
MNIGLESEFERAKREGERYLLTLAILVRGEHLATILEFALEPLLASIRILAHIVGGA